MAQNFNLKNIRTLLTEGFTDEELRRLCYDNPEFRPVYEKLADGMGKAKVIQELVEYAERQERMETLLAMAKEFNPARYEKHQPYTDVIIASTTFSSAYEKSQRASKGLTRPLYSYHSHPAANEFFYKLGNIEIPVKRLVGFPESPYSKSEVHIDYSPLLHHQHPDYPTELKEIRPYIQKYQVTPEMRNNLLARLNRITVAGETGDDKRGEITLNLAQTDFFTFLTTNRALDNYPVFSITKLGDDRKQTIRQAFISSSYTLENFALANPISTHVVLISQNIDQSPSKQVIIQKRTKHTHSFHEWYIDSAAGYVNISHQDEYGNPNPFITAVTEARQEIADLLELDAQDYKLIGIAVNWEDLDINAYGFINTNYSVRELLGDFARDKHEGVLEAIPFDPSIVLEHIVRYKWEPISALNMCATLLANFPPKYVRQIASEVIPKGISDFFE